MKIAFRIVVTLGVLLAIGFAGVKWFASKAQSAVNQPTTARIEPVLHGDLVEYITATGEVEPRTKVSISARVSARVAKVPFKEGDRVKAGDTLVKLDDSDLDAAHKSATARHAAQLAEIQVSQHNLAATRQRIAAMNVMLADAKREVERQKPLVPFGDVTKATVEQLQAKVDQQTAEILGAEASLKGDEGRLIVLSHTIEAAAQEIARAKDNLAYATITSPIDGIVTRLNVEVGELVVVGTMNNAGTMIMEVADLSAMIVKARVDEASISQVKQGQKCRVRMEAYRDKTFDGTVSNVALANFDPSLSRGSMSRSGGMMDGGKYFKVEILLKTEDGQRIFSGLSADVDIETNRHEKIVKVPSQAVVGRLLDSLPADIRNSPEIDVKKTMVPVVYRVLNDETVVTPVTIGASDFTHTVIKSGLKENELVITGPYKVLETIQHAQKVKADRPTTQPASQPSTHPSSRPTTEPAITQSAPNRNS